MIDKASYLKDTQPDILEVIANLSNEQVFTPPKVANQILDLLPQKVWSDPSLKWLDPSVKTGVFLREATKRLMVGLGDHFSDEQERLEHILKNMLFGVATEEITGLMARRSVYCSKEADSDFSVVDFDTSEGNIWQKKVEHKFNEKGRCEECGGSKASLEKKNRDNKAYGFIHSDGLLQISEDLGMYFDVIIGNPPYQMDMGETSDVPLYDKFINQAISLNPSYMSMIIPSRWMQGGKGLDEFRRQMLSDKRLSKLVDFSQMASVFPGAVDFEGGVCYFLWESKHNGKCAYEFHQGDEILGPIDRELDQYDVLIRDFRALAILEKIQKLNEPLLVDIVSGQTPFGLLTNFKGYRKGEKKPSDIKLFLTESGQRTEKWVDPEQIHKNHELMRAWKVLVPGAYGERGALPARVLGPTLIAPPRSACTQTYLAIGPLKTRSEAESLDSYLSTRFVRFLVSLRKISQHAWRGTYSWVPQQDWSQEWSDDLLFTKYKINAAERKYIESMIKEMA